MKNKVLIKVIVPELESTYDIFIPVNEYIWRIKALIIKAISDINGNVLAQSDNYSLLDKSTSTIYQNDQIVLNTDIRNASELYLLRLK